MSIVKSSRLITYSVEAQTEDQAETIYTCPANCRSMMSLLFLSNSDGNTTVDVMWVRQNGTQHIHILGGKNMTSGEYIQFSDAVIVFEPGDYMTITPSGNTAPHMDCLVTVEEIFIPIG
jgi:hypothetical protein